MWSDLRPITQAVSGTDKWSKGKAKPSSHETLINTYHKLTVLKLSLFSVFCDQHFLASSPYRGRMSMTLSKGGLPPPFAISITWNVITTSRSDKGFLLLRLLHPFKCHIISYISCFDTFWWNDTYNEQTPIQSFFLN